MKISGEVLKYEMDNISTDQIWPGRLTYKQIPFEEMGQYAMEGLDPNFPEKANGKILVTGKNFGCGSSREQAVACLASAGIQAVVSASQARIFYRNSINLGLPPIESEEAENLEDGYHLNIDLTEGIMEINEERRVEIPEYNENVLDIISEGGLINHLQNKLGE